MNEIKKCVTCRSLCVMSCSSEDTGHMMFTTNLHKRSEGGHVQRNATCSTCTNDVNGDVISIILFYPAFIFFSFHMKHLVLTWFFGRVFELLEFGNYTIESYSWKTFAPKSQRAVKDGVLLNPNTDLCIFISTVVSVWVGENSCRDLCLLSNIMEIDGTLKKNLNSSVLHSS